MMMLWLALAFFMEDGYYYTGIKKMRNLYAQKLQTALNAFGRWGADFVSTVDTRSGINLSLRVRSARSAEELSAAARSLKLQVLPLAQMSESDETGTDDLPAHRLIFYYNQVPLADLEERIRMLLDAWRE